MTHELRDEFWHDGARFVVCRGYEARRVHGRVLSGSEAVRIIGARLRPFGGDQASVRSMYGRFNSCFDLRRISNWDVLEWFTRELGVGIYGSAYPHLVLIELDRGARFGSSLAAQGRRALASASEAQNILRGLQEALRSQDLTHHGQLYRLATAATQARLEDRDWYEALSPRESQLLLRAMAQDLTRTAAVRDLLEKAAETLTEPTTAAVDQLVLLRRHRTSSRTAEAQEAPITPSQLKQMKKARELDWVTIQFVDDAGVPMANEAYEVTLADGSTEAGTLDANGLGHLSGIITGRCTVRFPSFKPRLAS